MIRGISYDVIGGFGVSSLCEPRVTVASDIFIRYYRSAIPNTTRSSTDRLFQAASLAITVSDHRRESAIWLKSSLTSLTGYCVRSGPDLDPAVRY